jgi:hypothetical protein
LLSAAKTHTHRKQNACNVEKEKRGVATDVTDVRRFGQNLPKTPLRQQPENSLFLLKFFQ